MLMVGMAVIMQTTPTILFAAVDWNSIVHARDVVRIPPLPFEYLWLYLYSPPLPPSHTPAHAAVFRTAQPHLQTFWGHARVELGPPTPGQWPQIKTGFSKLWNSTLAGRFLDVSVSEATRNTLIAIETGCWFYVGQVIGRKSLIGYKV